MDAKAVAIKPFKELVREHSRYKNPYGITSLLLPSVFMSSNLAYMFFSDGCDVYILLSAAIFIFFMGVVFVVQTNQLNIEQTCCGLLMIQITEAFDICKEQREVMAAQREKIHTLKAEIAGLNDVK